MSKYGKTGIITFTVLAVSFFVGLWYALPLTGIVNDEMFPGGALRAMSNYSIFPQDIDILYGTITYYLTYIPVLFLVIVIFIYTGFSITETKAFLIENIHLSYFGARIVSFLSIIFLLFIFLKLCEKSNVNRSNCIYATLLLFSTMIIQTIFHTAKVWPVSLLFLILSFYFLYSSLSRSKDDYAIRSELLSIIFAFISFANFPLMGFGLICIPILLYYFRSNRKNVYSILRYSLLGLVIFVLLFLSNKAGILAQVKSIFFDYTLSDVALKNNISILHSLWLNICKMGILFPILLVVIGYSVLRGNIIKNKKLFYLSLIYFLVYLVAITVMARWSTDIESYLRYLMPIGFFLAFMLISIDFKIDVVHLIFAGVSLLYLVRIIYLLSIPTTSNIVYNWVKENLNDENVLIERGVVSDVVLPMNKRSFDNIKDVFCSTVCQYYRSNDSHDKFTSYIITEQSKPINSDIIATYSKDHYIVSDHIILSRNTGLAFKSESFDPSINKIYVPMIENIGNYFDFGLFSYHRLGRNIYIYKIIQ